MIHLYYKTHCPFSQFAIRLVADQPHQLIKMDDDAVWRETKRLLSEMTGQTIATVPQAFWEDLSTQEIKYIGDSDQLRSWLNRINIVN